jgi:hypothetical protein
MLRRLHGETGAEDLAAEAVSVFVQPADDFCIDIVNARVFR